MAITCTGRPHTRTALILALTLARTLARTLALTLALTRYNEFHHLLIMEALGGDQSW